MSIPLVADVRSILDTEQFGRSMRGFETVGSTNTEAMTWARDGADEGSVVVAEYQSAGRGRHGRTWDAHSDQNLTFSVVLRPALPPERLGLVTVAAGVAVAEAVESFVGAHRASIKWPNDVLLEGRKTCGMLLETAFAGRRDTADRPECVILGIGLNVNQTDFPDALVDRATSLRLVAGRTVPRPPVLARILDCLERRYAALPHDAAAASSASIDALRDAFHARMHGIGDTTTLRFHGTDRRLSGTVRGISDDGALRLDTDDGEQVLYAGEVTTQGARDAGH